MQKIKFEEEGLIDVFTEQDAIDVTESMNARHAAYLEGEEFKVETGANEDQVQLRVTLRKRDDSWAYPVECIHLREPGSKETTFTIAATMLDYLEIYWAEYLSEGRDTFVTLDWSKHSFEDLEFMVRGSIRNLSIEAQADELLRKHGFGDYDIEPISSET